MDLRTRHTFVATPKVEERFVQRAFGIHEDMEQRRIRLSTEVLRQE
jgi:GntR family transcriptional regulator